jgi:hypothetical protein
MSTLLLLKRGTSPSISAKIVGSPTKAKLGTADVQRTLVMPGRRTISALSQRVAVGSAIPALGNLRAEGVAEAAESGLAVTTCTLFACARQQCETTRPRF